MHEKSKFSANFLDVSVSIVDYKPETDLYCKPADCHQFPHFNSSHPFYNKKTIVYNQRLRIFNNFPKSCPQKVVVSEKILDELCDWMSYVDDLKLHGVSVSPPPPHTHTDTSGLYSPLKLSRITRLQGKREGVSLTSCYQFHSLHRHINQAITAHTGNYIKQAIPSAHSYQSDLDGEPLVSKRKLLITKLCTLTPLPHCGPVHADQ